MTPVRHNNGAWLPSIFNDLFDNDWMVRTNATAPAINVLESESDYKVELAAPGLTKNDFSISIDEQGDLVIAMEKKSEKTEGDANGNGGVEANKSNEVRYLRREFNYSKFQQTLGLPDDVNKDGISAKMENGVLTIALPKYTASEKEKAQKVIDID